MTRRFGWLLAPAVMGAILYFSQSAAAQKQAANDQGQQGEFNGEHVDTGAAALDTGPEAAEPSEGIEATESVKTPLSTSGTTVTKGTSASAVSSHGSTEDRNVEGDFDLQEITGVDVPEAN